MKLSWLLQDVNNFLNQFIPSPVAVFLRYRFSPADLAALTSQRRLGKSTKPEGSESSISDNSILHTFDVLSYNINNAASSKPNRVRLILRAIFSSGASIILLQETNPAWEKLLLDDAIALQYRHRYFHHPYIGDKNRPPDRSASGIAIISQYPLKDIEILDLTKDVSGSVFPALVCKAILPAPVLDQKQGTTNVFSGVPDEEGICIRVANVHLRPPVNLDGSARFDTARKTEPIRLAEVKGLLRTTASKNSSRNDLSRINSELDIIAGDFNEDNSGAALSYLSMHYGYIDALQQFVPRRKETHKWPFLKNMWTLRKRLDHILWRSSLLFESNQHGKTKLTFQLKCLGCGVLTGYENGASDHQPVLARFGIFIDDQILTDD